MRLIEVEDAAFVADLRADVRRNEHLSQASANVAAQAEWIGKYKLREQASEEFYFVIEDEKIPVGLVRIYGIEGGSFTWGSWIMKADAPAHCAIESALQVYEFAYGVLGLTHCHFEVRKGNERVWAFHERMGATRVGEDDQQFFYHMPREAYLTARERYAKFLPS
tara:strand:- start:2913 stop:3407 length:495 start_codon:yes stop_codon:yes gene_type:complete